MLALCWHRLYLINESEVNEMKKMCICWYCIQAIRSHGEKVYIGDPIENQDNDPLVCDWCDDEAEELYEVIL